MKIVRNIVIIFIFTICFQINLIKALQDPNLQYNFEESIDRYVAMFPECVEGFDILHAKGNLIEGQEHATFRDFLKINYSMKDNACQTNLPELHLQAKKIICDQMTKPLYKILHDESIKSYTNIDKIKDPIFFYVVKHQPGFMYEVVKKLINMKSDHQFLPPLLYACRANNIEMIDFLLSIGADIHIECRHQKNIILPPLHAAISDNNLNVARILIFKGANVNRRTGSNSTNLFFGLPFISPLHIAAEKNYSHAAQLLIDKGADVDIEDQSYMTPLSKAVLFGNLEVAIILITAGADVNQQGETWDTLPLYNAVQSQNKEMIIMLLDKGANPNIRTNSSNIYPLHEAIENSLDIEIIKLFIAAGANVNAQDGYYKGMTSLHVAVKSRNVEAAKLLIDSGVDINFLDKHGRTAEQLGIEIATKIKHLPEIFQRCIKQLKLCNEYMSFQNVDTIEEFLLYYNQDINNESHSKFIEQCELYYRQNCDAMNIDSRIQLDNRMSEDIRNFWGSEQIKQQKEIELLFTQISR